MMLYGGTGTFASVNVCCCTGTICCCHQQGTQAVTGTQVVTVATNRPGIWVITRQVLYDPDPEPIIVFPRYWAARSPPPPRYRRAPLQFSRLCIGRKTEVRRTRRERGHAFGHSPRRRSRH